MTVWYAKELQGAREINNAASKARMDLEQIILEMGIAQLIVDSNTEDRIKGSSTEKVRGHFIARRQWSKALAHVRSGDAVIVQFPPRNHTILFGWELRAARARGVKVILFLHDLEVFREINARRSVSSAVRLVLEERSSLLQADAIVCHNKSMIAAIEENFHVPKSKLFNLEIFDYLMGTTGVKEGSINLGAPVVVAGNLRPDKAGYVYMLPKDVPFNLYGPYYDESRARDGNVSYKGSFPPEELIDHIEGSYGLVWDGDSANTCSGVYGDYLRVNNPHKCSFYLAMGMPVIVWENAAIAPLIRELKVGFSISKLSELADEINKNQHEYEVMRSNSLELSRALKSGEYTKNVIMKVLAALDLAI